MIVGLAIDVVKINIPGFDLLDWVHRKISSLLSLFAVEFWHEILSDPFNRKWQDYVYIQCEYKSTKQKIKHLLREENKVKENKIS